MIKKILFHITTLIGILAIVITLTAKRIVEGFDSEAIDAITKYVFEFQATKDLESAFNGDIGIMFAFYKVSEYSHLIITLSIIWIILSIYFLGLNRRSKVEDES